MSVAQPSSSGPSSGPSSEPSSVERLVSVEVVVPDGVFWSGDARSVTVPAASGTVGILARHQPVAAELTAGRVRVRSVDRPTAEMRISGGFVVVDDDVVTVLADDARWVPAR